MHLARIEFENLRGCLDGILADIGNGYRVPTRTALALVATGVAFAASGVLACARPRAAQPVGCSASTRGLEPAFRALPVAPSGVVGATHHFHRDIPLHPKTPIERMDLANGARIYEAATVVAERPYPIGDLATLRSAFRVASNSTMSGPRFVNRCAVGYVRAPFPAGTAMDAPPSATDGTTIAGDDAFVSYSDWRIFAGWEDGGILVEDGDAYRFDAHKLYVNLSSWMRLPVWSARSERPDAERSTWDAYVCDLRAHEALHLETSRATARFFLEVLATLRAPSVAALEAKFLVVLARSLDWGRDEDRRIDDYTGHGPILLDRPRSCGPS